MEAIRAGNATTKQDYKLRTGVTQQKLNLEDLQKLIDEYEVLIAHEETDYAKVFIKKHNVTKQMLMKRCQEWVEIQDNANPVFDLIEKCTTDVQNLINKAAHGAEASSADDPMKNQMAALGHVDGHLSNADMENLQGKSGHELIQLQRE